MKSDLDRLMQERNLDAFIVASDENYNAVRDYLSNGARVTGGYVIKKRGEPPVMIVNPMETEEARESGLKVISRSELNYHELIVAYKEKPDALLVAWWHVMLKAADVYGGRVGVYGAGDLNVFVEVFRMLDADLPDYTFVGETGLTLFDEAMLTKDAEELARIKAVALLHSTVSNSH